MDGGEVANRSAMRAWRPEH